VEKIMSLYETISTKLIECDLDSIEIFKHGSKYEVTFEWEDISFEFTFHERNKEHLEDSHKAACYVAKKYDWCEINCVKDDNIRTIEDIHEEIYKTVKECLDE
jgi:hypothetical protein